MEHSKNILCFDPNCTPCKIAGQEFHDMCVKEVQKEINKEIIDELKFSPNGVK